MVDDEESDSVDTTDSTLEPSTSPNPPTEKKEWKPMVTQPAHSEKKKNPEYVTYIESRPVGRWQIMCCQWHASWNLDYQCLFSFVACNKLYGVPQTFYFIKNTLTETMTC